MPKSRSALSDGSVGSGLAALTARSVSLVSSHRIAAPAIEAEFPGTQALGFGHLGDGNIHFHVLAPPGVIHGEWAEGQGKAISARVHDLVTAASGSISAEHGIGQMKRDELARLGDPVALALLRQVKLALDPKGLMNPGKVIPAKG